MKTLARNAFKHVCGGICERKDEENLIIFNCNTLNDYPQEISLALQAMNTERKSMNINWTQNREPFDIRLSWWWCRTD